MYLRTVVLILMMICLVVNCAPKNPQDLAIMAGKQILNDRFVADEGLKFKEMTVIADTTVDGSEWFMLFCNFEAIVEESEISSFQYYISLKFDNSDYQNPIYDKTRSVKTCDMSREKCIDMMKSLNQWPGFEWE
ncbi:hypothetical protein JXI42_03125 [bacterium]|nr:hypothetical protein [bacterium]